MLLGLGGLLGATIIRTAVAALDARFGVNDAMGRMLEELEAKQRRRMRGILGTI